ncbi:hypothetical protein [Demequina sp.]|uniref:hypothetical protein n=1 Tax=Demequina sp. TaxID=2050685 RepID=UPI0025B8150C|nr:hypothetical protein [Demequina sp.]
MTPEQHHAWLQGVLATLSARRDVVGVVGMGSTADPSRVDEWSDHDIAIIVKPEATAVFRDGLVWLPHPEDLVLRTVEHHGGGKAVYSNGHLVEWGVATLESLRTWVADRYRVLLDRGGVAETMAEIASRRFAANEADAERDIAVFLFELLHGVGRWRRGERISAGNVIRNGAVGALLRAVRATLPSHEAGALDRLDGFRRIEQAYPIVAAQIAEAVAQSPETAARRLLAIATEHLGVGPTGLPPAAVQAVKRRIGWSTPA